MAQNERPQKVAIYLAQRIVHDIVREKLKASDLLQPEHVMLERYEIGRGTLREALRLLEFQGVITLKPGPKGGPVLRSPDPSHLASSLLLLMQLKGAPFRAIVEGRTARILPEELAELSTSVEDIRANLNDTDILLGEQALP
jgi:GntR family transcriptional regulator, transcriptional repressor for pyruvate dehydrogenase complex